MFPSFTKNKKYTRDEVRNIKAITEILKLVEDGTIEKRLKLANELEELVPKLEAMVSTVVNKTTIQSINDFDSWWLINKEDDYQFSDEITKLKAKMVARSAWFAAELKMMNLLKVKQ